MVGADQLGVLCRRAPGMVPLRRPRPGCPPRRAPDPGPWEGPAHWSPVGSWVPAQAGSMSWETPAQESPGCGRACEQAASLCSQHRVAQ